MKHLFPMIVVALFASSLSAQFMDRDRPQQTGPQDAIIGKFMRWPDAYYLQRIDRLKSTKDPTEMLDLVCAQIRIAANTDARATLAELQRSLVTLTDADEINRFTALIGASGATLARQNNPDDLNTSVQMLSDALLARPDIAAIKLHRRYLEWLTERVAYRSDAPFPSFLDSRLTANIDTDDSDNGERQHNVLGVERRELLVALVHDRRWNDLDMIYALSRVFYVRKEPSMARLAWLRCCELIDGGAKSHVTHSLSPTDLKRAMAYGLDIEILDTLPEWYTLQRNAADEWQQKRFDYADSKLATGSHPDTDKAFWHDFNDNPLADEDPDTVIDPTQERTANLMLMMGGGILFMIILTVGGIVVLRRTSSGEPTMDEI